MQLTSLLGHSTLKTTERHLNPNVKTLGEAMKRRWDGEEETDAQVAGGREA